MESFMTRLQKKFELLLRLREMCSQGHEAEIQQLVESLRHCQGRWRNAEVELMTSRSLLGKAAAEQTSQDVRLQHARNQLDLEIRRRHNVELANQQLERQMQLIREILMNDEAIVGAMDEEQKTLLTFLSSQHGPSDPSKRASGCGDLSGSTLSHSGISYDRTDDEQLDMDPVMIRQKKSKNKDKRGSARPVVAAPPVIARRSRCRSQLFVADSGAGSSTGEEMERKQTPVPALPRRRSNCNPPPSLTDRSALGDGNEDLERERAQTPVPPATPPPPSPAWSPRPPQTPFTPRVPFRAHTFMSKTVIRPESCLPCGKRVGFGKLALRCSGCRLLTHPGCRDRCPALCVPSVTGGPVRNGQGRVADFAPRTTPMIPALVIHCINEIEQRGLQETGIYRVQGCERTVRELKERYLRGKGLPLLSRVTDVHVVCGLLKDFLRKLQEPLVTFRLHHNFLAAAGLPSDEPLYQAISQLPQANRDTLAFVILHLHRVMRSAQCKMNKWNLASVFGPTLVGHATPEPDPLCVLQDTRQQPKVVERLLSLPLEYWREFLPCSQPASAVPTPGRIFQPLTTPDRAERNNSPTCCLSAGLLLLPLSGGHKAVKLFPSPTLK